MTDELAKLVQEIKARAHAVTSFVAKYRSAYRLQLMPFEGTGTVHFLGPDRFRSTTIVKNEEIVTIRRGSKVQRYLPGRKEIWKYELKDLPQTQPINAGIADLNNPFFAVDEDSLAYEGLVDQQSIHAFQADIKNWATQGLLDTRKGFSIRYKPMSLDVRIKLRIGVETGLLQSMTGTDKTGKEVFQMEYQIERINVALDESLFIMEETTAEYKTIDITETLLASLNPDAAEAPPSKN